MDAQAIKTLGGICQILGVLIVVRDLLAVHDYLGDLDRLTARVHARRAAVEAAVRRLLPRRRPGSASVGGASLSARSVTRSTGSARLGKAPGPFIQPPHQPLQEQIAGQAEYLNRLRDWMAEELKLRDQVTDAERERARTELAAERERLDRVIGEADWELKELRKLTTSGIGSRWLGVPVLLAGVAFSTWPDGWAKMWPPWLSTVALGFLVACGLAVWLCWAILARLRADSATS
jgi:hypothetical protein